MIEKRKYVKKPTRDFTSMMKVLTVSQFAQMVSRAGLPVSDARELCASFRKLKE